MFKIQVATPPSVQAGYQLSCYPALSKGKLDINAIGAFDPDTITQEVNYMAFILLFRVLFSIQTSCDPHI